MEKIILALAVLWFSYLVLFEISVLFKLISIKKNGTKKFKAYISKIDSEIKNLEESKIIVPDAKEYEVEPGVWITHVSAENRLQQLIDINYQLHHREYSKNKYTV